MNEIIVKHGINKKLGEITGKSQPFIRWSLRGLRESKEAMKVRRAAILNGGVEILPSSENVTASKNLKI